MAESGTGVRIFRPIRENLQKLRGQKNRLSMLCEFCDGGKAFLFNKFLTQPCVNIKDRECMITTITFQFFMNGDDRKRAMTN
jgi:hypothetical protein